MYWRVKIFGFSNKAGLLVLSKISAQFAQDLTHSPANDPVFSHHDPRIPIQRRHHGVGNSENTASLSLYRAAGFSIIGSGIQTRALA